MAHSKAPNPPRIHVGILLQEHARRTRHICSCELCFVGGPGCGQKVYGAKLLSIQKTGLDLPSFGAWHLARGLNHQMPPQYTMRCEKYAACIYHCSLYFSTRSRAQTHLRRFDQTLGLLAVVPLGSPHETLCPQPSVAFAKEGMR